VIPRKSLVMMSELYLADKEDKGLRLLPFEIGQRMYDHELNNGFRVRTEAGPADASIFDKDRGMASIHDDYVKRQIRFTKPDKRPGSRERGFLLTRQRLKATATRNPEMPWVYFHRNCVNWISQIGELPISPENPQDVHTGSNDHIYDGVRYRFLKSLLVAGSTETMGT
jgi:hypothetical protein